MAAFATVEDLATAMRIGGDPGELSAQDSATATYLLDVATQMIKDYTGRELEQVTEESITLDGNGSCFVTLPESPVTAVTSVTLDGTLLVEETDYIWRYWGSLERIGATWGTKWQSIVVVYTHGYATIPNSIKGVCVDLAKRAFENPAGIQRDDLNTASQWLGLTEENRQVLDSYSRLLLA